MDKNIKWLNESRINTTIESLKKNGINGYLVNNHKELIDKINELTKDGDIDYLRSGKYKFLDRYVKGLSKDDLKKLYRDTFSADVYFTSINAITEKGELYNVDGNGNRVAAMLYGPDKVIVIAGVNKIVKDIEDAVIRNERISAPANCKRLNRNTPCVKVGHCVNCASEERICSEYTIIKTQRNKDRIHVIFLNEELGY